VDLGARVWTWLLRRAFNPHSARDVPPGNLQRRWVWLAQSTLAALYGPGHPG
jgi:hypothetical protein